jgi:hypothetical protein
LGKLTSNEAMCGVGDKGNGVSKTFIRQSRWLQGGREGDAAVPDFPEYGSTLPVNLYKPIEKQMVSPRFPKLQLPHKSLSELPALGSWVKLKNVCVVVVEGQLQVHASSPRLLTHIPPLQPNRTLLL